MLTRIAPYVFVVLWASGFIGSKLGSADAEPFTFLAVRFLIVLAILVPLAMITASRTRNWAERGHAIVAGMLIHGAYLGGVFWAIRHGMPAGVIALIVSLQPVVTSLLAGLLLGEALTVRHWTGTALGLAGVILILGPKLTAAASAAHGIDGATLTSAVIALAGMTAGTLYQKRFVTGLPIVAGTVWQFIGALALIGGLALAFETRQVTWTPKFMIALGWLSFVVSIGAISMLMVLIRDNAVAGISGLFYMTPAVTAVMAYVLFGETMDGLQLAGLVLVTIAVLMIVRVPAAEKGAQS